MVMSNKEKYDRLCEILNKERRYNYEKIKKALETLRSRVELVIRKHPTLPEHLCQFSDVIQLAKQNECILSLGDNDDVGTADGLFILKQLICLVYEDNNEEIPKLLNDVYNMSGWYWVNYE
jgi:hypothetical protein